MWFVLVESGGSRRVRGLSPGSRRCESAVADVLGTLRESQMRWVPCVRVSGIQAPPWGAENHEPRGSSQAGKEEEGWRLEEMDARDGGWKVCG